MGCGDRRALTSWPLGEQKTRLRENGKDPQWNESPQWKVRGTLPFFSLHQVLCMWMNDCGELRVFLSSTHAYREEAGGSGHPGVSERLAAAHQLWDMSN